MAEELPNKPTRYPPATVAWQGVAPDGHCELTRVKITAEQWEAGDWVVRPLVPAAPAPSDETPQADRSSREAAMVVVSHRSDGTADVWCDPEIADLVAALNAAGIRTVASCSGHGHRPGRITLADGREIVLPRDAADLERIEAAFPVDINGEAKAPHTIIGERVSELALCQCDRCGGDVIYDLVIPDKVWAEIAPKPVEGWMGGGVLCPTCIVAGLLALRTPASAGAVAVRKLEWTEGRPNGDRYAASIVGQYGVGKIGVGYCAMLRMVEDGQDHDHMIGRAFADDAVAMTACRLDLEARINSALTHPLPTDEAATHRHRKGGEYVLIGYGRMQTEHWRDPNLDAEYDNQAVDMRQVAIYRSVKDGSLWVRPREEFEDGRFAALEAARSIGGTHGE